jgi:hypothetical protein
MSYKFALVNQGVVENIVECQDYEFSEILKPQYEAVINVNNVQVEIGFLWNGSTFSENPKQTEEFDYNRETQQKELEEFKKASYRALDEKYKNDPNSLSPNEKALLDLYRVEFGEL